MSDFEKRLKKCQEAYNKADEAFQKASKEYFAEAVADIFIRHPDLKEFSFTMYTPSYNDGDACYFRVNFDYCMDDEDDESLKKTGLTEEAQATISKNLSLFPDSFYERTFGTATRLTCYRDGRIVQDYYDCGY